MGIDLELLRKDEVYHYEVFQTLYEQHKDKIYRFCVSHLNGIDDVDDVTQETWAYFYLYLRKMPHTDNIRALIFKIALSKCRKKYNNWKRFWFYSKNSQNLTTENAIDVEKMIEFNRNLAKLKAPDRELINMYIIGLSYDEIAIILGEKSGEIPRTDMIRQRMARAIDRLKRSSR